MWDPGELLTSVATGLSRREHELRAEDAVRGLDALSELQLHAEIAAAMHHAGLTLCREQPYPGRPQSRPRHRERERCDLVVLPSGCTALADPVQSLLEQDTASGTLFASHTPPPDPAAAAPADAYWIEIKVVGQFAPRHGVPLPNTSYASDLVTALSSDLDKLSREPLAPSAAVLLVLFTATTEIATHDVDAALHRVLDKGVSFRAYRREQFPILDRIGNTACTLLLVERATAG